MPVTAAIKFTQGFTTDIAGRALIGVAGAAVTMTNGDDTDVFDWTWEITTKPSASAIPTGVIAAGAVISASFTPDVVGSYMGRLTVKDTAGNQAIDIRAFIVREGSGRIIPPFRGDFASLNYGGQVEGWDPAMESWLHSTDGRAPLENASTGPIDDITSTDPTDSTAAEGITFTNVVSPVVNGIAGGYGGRRLYVMAAGSAVGLANENLGSLAENRIITGTGADTSLQTGSIAWLIYDSTALRWRAQPVASGGGVPLTRNLTAGAGLTGGGDLSLDRIFDVVANADGSMIINADDIQVGVLATDAQHGLRGGGTQHADVVPAGDSGFMTGADKTKLDGISALAAALTANAPTTIQPDDVANVGVGTEAARDDHLHAIAADAPGAVGVATASDEGVATSFARSDHAHQSNTAPVNVTKAAAVIGVSGEPARADHKHDADTAVAVTVGFANAEGVSTSLSRADHVHLGDSSILLWGNDDLTGTTTTRYLTPCYEESTAGTTARQWRAPRAGTLRNLSVRQNIAAGNGNAIVYTIRVNGVASALSVSMASTANDGGPDADTVAVAAGDLLDIEVTKALSVVTSPTGNIASVEFGA